MRGSGESIAPLTEQYRGRRGMSGLNGANGAVPWGVSAQTGELTDVLLGKPDFFRWVPLNSISAVTFANQEQMGHRFDRQKAMHQHRLMVNAYEKAVVRCHFA